MGFRTRQIHAGVTPDPQTGSILTPIYQTTTYVQPSVDEYLSKGYTYSRSGNAAIDSANCIGIAASLNDLLQSGGKIVWKAKPNL